MVHILTYEGAKVNSSRPHGASVTCLRLDEENDFVATASVEGELPIGLLRLYLTAYTDDQAES